MCSKVAVDIAEQRADKKAEKRRRQREQREAARVIAVPEGVDAASGAEPCKNLITCKVRGEEDPTWPTVACMEPGCRHVDRWSRMRRWKELLHFQKDQADREDEVKWHYRCLCCFARSAGLSVATAKAKLYEMDEGLREKSRRAQKYQEARAEVIDSFEMYDACYKQVRRVTLSFLDALLEPLASFILRKQQALDQLVQDDIQIRRLQSQLRECHDGETASKLVQEIERLKGKNYMIAFQKRPDQMDMIRASTFSDEWSCIPNLGHLRHWFLCRRGGSWGECGTLILSKRWHRLHSAPWAKGQRYYCPVCTARYTHNSGVLVEVGRIAPDGEVQITMGLADVPEMDVEDIRAAKAEADENPATPAQMFELAKEAKPSAVPLIRQARQDELANKTDSPEGVYRVTDLAALDALPKWCWWRLLGRQKPEPKKRRR